MLVMKPGGLGSRIRDMEAEIYDCSHLLVSISIILFISFGKQNWHCRMNKNLRFLQSFYSNLYGDI